MLAVGSDDGSVSGGKVLIYEWSDHTQEWLLIKKIAQVMDPVNDIAFAPNVGLSYHMLAIASTDLFIFHLRLNEEEDVTSVVPITNNNGYSNGTQLNLNQVARFSDHSCNVLRVAWNDFGDLLISNGDDGQIFVWMSDYQQKWQNAGLLRQGSSVKSGYSLQSSGMTLDTTAAPYY